MLTLDGLLAARIVFVRSSIDCGKGRHLPVMTFGPVSVAPAFQKRGLGSLLLREAIKRAKALGVGALCITGDVAFYRRFGFTPRIFNRHQRHVCRPDRVFCGSTI